MREFSKDLAQEENAQRRWWPDIFQKLAPYIQRSGDYQAIADHDYRPVETKYRYPPHYPDIALEDRHEHFSGNVTNGWMHNYPTGKEMVLAYVLITGNRLQDSITSLTAYDFDKLKAYYDSASDTKEEKPSLNSCDCGGYYTWNKLFSRDELIKAGCQIYPRKVA